MPENEEEINYKEFYPGFTVVCDKCGSQNVRLENSMGFSAESGAWGSLDLICDDCENTVSIVEP